MFLQRTRLLIFAMKLDVCLSAFSVSSHVEQLCTHIHTHMNNLLHCRYYVRPIKEMKYTHDLKVHNVSITDISNLTQNDKFYWWLSARHTRQWYLMLILVRLQEITSSLRYGIINPNLTKANYSSRAFSYSSRM